MAANITLPITNQLEFEITLEYLAQRSGDLAERVCGVRYPVSILKIFAKDPEEYELVKKLVDQHGPESPVSSGMSHYVEVNSGLKVLDVPLTLLGVRRPGNDRTERGCGDYELADFDEVAADILAMQPQYARPVNNAHGLGMVELRHPDFDVLGYIVPLE